MASERLKALVVQQFPFPIAFYFRRAVEEKEPWEASCHLLLSLLEFLGTVLACDYLSGEERSPEVDQKLAKIFLALPTDGDWHGLIFRILEFQEERQRTPFLRGLAQLRSRTAESELARLVKCRNDWVHRKFRFRIGQFRRDLMTVLARIESLRESALIFARSSRMGLPLHLHEINLFKGDNPNFAVVECRSEAVLESEKMYLFSGETRELLCLDPLMTYAPCGSCPERHFFQHNKVDRRKVIYSSVPGHHEMRSPETFLRIEHLVHSGRSSRLNPRFFSLPGDFLGIPRTRHAEDRVGQYRIEEVLKIEGLSQVYRATDTRSGASCALKVLPMELSRDPILLMRFDEEALTLKRIEHPGVIKIRDMGEDFGDRYLVLDLATGGRIGSQVCRDLSEAAKPLREEVIIDLAKQICDALRHVHSLGIVHRDLKPGNLLLSGNKVLVADFGIAHSRGNDGVTLTGMPVGTPNYMAPEQILGEPVDHRTDLYSLGCALYEFATGRPPYDAEMPLTTTLYHLQAAPADIRELNPRISPGLANIILKLLQKDPGRRYQSAQDLFRDLSRASKDPAGAQVFPGEKMPGAMRAEIQKKLKRQYRLRIVLTVTVSAVLLVGMLLFLLAKAYYWDWKVESWVKEATSAWEDRRWPEALEALQRAHRKNRESPSVQGFLSRIATEGALTIHTRPEGLEMELFPDDEAARQVELPAARLLPGEGPRFRSGMRIRLGIGLWRINISRPAAGPWAQALVYIGQVRRSQETGWQAPQHLTLETQAFRLGRQQDSSSFVLGEEVVIDQLALPDPEWLSEGMVWVNEGPFWRSVAPSSSSIEPRDEDYIDHFGEKQRMKVYDASSKLERDYLTRGFLMSTDEVTVGKFKKWYEKLGPQVFPWLAEREAMGSLRKRCTSLVDIRSQKDCWREALKARNIDVDSIDTPEKLLDAVFEPDLESMKKRWSGYESTLGSFIATLDDDNRPMVSIGRNLAMFYARTQADIRPEEFKSWLKWKVHDANAASLGLCGAKQIVADMPGESVDPACLPGGPLIDNSWLIVDSSWPNEWKSEREPLLEGYAYWLSAGAFYGCQLPVERILAWAKDAREVKAVFSAGDLDLIQKRVTCSAWLGKRPRQGFDDGIKPKTNEQKLIDLYGQAIHEKKERPLKDHLLRWIEEKIQEEEAGIKNWEALLARMDAEPAEAFLASLSFEIRYRYGIYMGWEIPEWRQWEKACRGPDGRAYPWGDRQDDQAAWLNQGVDPRPRTIIAARMRDLSPYGVWCMGGNVSEWVHRPIGQDTRHFVKGGNCALDSLYSNAGYFLSLVGGANTMWVGIRVVRNIRPPPPPAR